jgi:hypothetical protein
MATFWIGDNPERAAFAAAAVQPLYQELRPLRPMLRVEQGGILYLGWVTELEDIPNASGN